MSLQIQISLWQHENSETWLQTLEDNGCKSWISLVSEVIDSLPHFFENLGKPVSYSLPVWKIGQIADCFTVPWANLN